MALLGKRKENPEARMSLGGHLREFRNRAVISAIAILIGTVGGWFLYEHVYDYLQQPLWDFAQERHLKRDQVNVNFNGVTNPFTLKFKISLWMGFILAAPVWLWEIWAFLVPGLTKRERRVGLSFIGSAIPLFAAGVYMGVLCFGSAIRMLMEATPGQASNLPTATEYFSFVMRFILAFGLSFLLPIFLMGLNMVGILPARRMLKGWRIAIIAIAVFAALMTPTGDVWTMFVLAAPLVVLFYGTVAFAFAIEKLRKRRGVTNRPDWATTDDDKASAL